MLMARLPQSAQSVPRRQSDVSDPGPPSLHTPSPVCAQPSRHRRWQKGLRWHSASSGSGVGDASGSITRTDELSPELVGVGADCARSRPAARTRPCGRVLHFRRGILPRARRAAVIGRRAIGPQGPNTCGMKMCEVFIGVISIVGATPRPKPGHAEHVRRRHRPSASASLREHRATLAVREPALAEPPDPWVDPGRGGWRCAAQAQCWATDHGRALAEDERAASSSPPAPRRPSTRGRHHHGEEHGVRALLHHLQALYVLRTRVRAGALGRARRRVLTAKAEVRLDPDGIFAIVSVLEPPRPAHGPACRPPARRRDAAARSPRGGVAVVRKAAPLKVLDLSCSALGDELVAEPLKKLLAGNTNLVPPPPLQLPWAALGQGAALDHLPQPHAAGARRRRQCRVAVAGAADRAQRVPQDEHHSARLRRLPPSRGGRGGHQLLRPLTGAHA